MASVGTSALSRLGSRSWVQRPRLLPLLLPALCSSAHPEVFSGRAPKSTDVLFVLHDAGETFALQAPMRRLAAEGTAVLALVLGQPATDAIRCQGDFEGCDRLPSVSLLDFGVHVDILDGTDGRDQRLNRGQLAKVAKALAPRLVITGMNYQMQLQLGEAFRAEHGGKFAAFFDGLRMLGSDNDISSDLQLGFVQESDQVWIASPLLWPTGEAWGRNYAVVGHPTLEDWRTLSANHAAVAGARRAVYGESVAASGAPSLCWFGGYGPGYREALRTWCAAVKALAARTPQWKFALASHPGSNYKMVDIEILQEEGVLGLVAMAPANLPGKMVALASNLTVSQGSTGGVQSVFAGKPALYLDPAMVFNNSAVLGVMLGLIPVSASTEAAVLAVDRIAAGAWGVDATKLSKAEVPEDGTVAVVNAARHLLSADG